MRCSVEGSRVLVPAFLEGKIDYLAVFWRARYIRRRIDFFRSRSALTLVVLDEYPY
jgi:hypothetical protein